MLNSVRGPLTAIVGCVGVFWVDQVCKNVFFGIDATDHRPTFSFLNGWVQSVRHENFGIAFNIPLPQWVILGVTLVACVGILVAIVRASTHQQLLPSLFLGVLLGGALGNGFDRLFLNYVRDWLLLWHRSAINIADLGVIIGLVGISWSQTRTTQPLDKV